MELIFNESHFDNITYNDDNTDLIYNIKYIKYKHYVIKINLLTRDLLLHDYQIEDNKYKFRVLDIINIVDNMELIELNDNIHTLKKNYINNDFRYNDLQNKFYDTYEEAFYDNFFENKQYLLFGYGYSGIYKKYQYNNNIKTLKIEYFHINGNKEGQYKEYDNDGNLKILSHYINNNLHGITEISNCMFYIGSYFSKKVNCVNINSNSNILVKLNYNMNKLHGKQQICSIDDKIIKEKYFYNNYHIPWILYIILEYFKII